MCRGVDVFATGKEKNYMHILFFFPGIFFLSQPFFGESLGKKRFKNANGSAIR